MTDTIRTAAAALRAFAGGLPGAYEDHPWDELVIKVNKKVFVFFGLETELERRLYLGVKLPATGVYALQLPGVTPMGYGLGKAGWVALQVPADAALPALDMLQEWVEESYRAVAPKRLIAQLDAARAPAAPGPAPSDP